MFDGTLEDANAMNLGNDQSSPRLSRRSFCGAGLALLAPWPAFAQSAQPPATTRPAPNAVKIAVIRGHADSLLQRAIRTNAGWGWSDEEVAGIDLTRGKHPHGKTYPISANLTAPAGLLLDLAGDLCRDASYHAAALEAAHGLAALQTRAGQIRTKGAMGVLTAVRDDPTDLPDRTATRQSLALLLRLIDRTPANEQPDARVKTAALRAAHWLGKQQNHSGGWPCLYPPDARKDQGIKILRLDTPDLRDTALAVLLASDVLGDQQLENYFDRAVEFLLPLRMTAGRPLRKAMWASAYRLDGDPATHVAGIPPIPDVLATRRMVETLLAGYLVTQKLKYDPPLKEARDTLAGLERNKNGEWYRRYDLALKPYQDAATQPTSIFAKPAQLADAAELRVPDLLARLEQATTLTSKQFHDELNRRLPIRQRLELLTAGVADDAILTDVDPAGATRSAALAGSGGFADTLDALWYELRTAGI